MGKVAYVLLLTRRGYVVDIVGLRRTVIIGFAMIVLLFLAYASFIEFLFVLLIIMIDNFAFPCFNLSAALCLSPIFEIGVRYFCRIALSSKCVEEDFL